MLRLIATGWVVLAAVGLATGAEPMTGSGAGVSREAGRPLVFGVNRVGDAGVLYDPPGYLEHMYRRIAEAGGTCVRPTASPRDIEAVRGQRDWREFDRDLGLALKYGQEPIVCIVNTPAWASPSGEATHLYPYKTELLPEFADFCTELAQRTRGKVRYFQLWNEQNGCSWHFHDGFNHADEYVPVLKVCHAALKKGNPDCILSLGSLDDAEGHGWIFMTKTYEEMKKQGVAGSIFDVVSTHPYSLQPAIMRAKLDVIGAIMAANGDGDKPLWITEYGWHTGNTTLEDQAARVATYLKAFTQPAWGDLQAAIYLSIADFEGRTAGFGLTDANLRPRPAFYAFQGASRFGAYPPYEIEPVWVAADRLVIIFKTLEPTTSIVTLERAEGEPAPVERRSPEGTQHRVELAGVAPGGYHFHIVTTRRQGSETRTASSVDYEIRTPGRQVFNGDFESGFFAGIAEDWRIEGEGFCTDGALMPRPWVSAGEHAQAVFACGDKGHRELDSTLSTVVAATPGEPMRLSLSWMGRATELSVKVSARVGIGPDGGEDPDHRGVQWEPWQEMKVLWEDHTVSVTPSNDVARLFVQCRSEGALGRATALFVLDSVGLIAAGAE